MGVSVPRHTSFVFTLRPTRAQEALLWRHVGAARFAFNQGLALHISAKRAAAGGSEPDVQVPYTGFDFINAFNAWKRSEQAGGTAETPGLPWCNEVFQGVFEEACVDLGRSLEGRTAWFKGDRAGRCPGLARFKKRGRARASFRVRNKVPQRQGKPARSRSTVRFRRLGVSAAVQGLPVRAVRLPAKLGGVLRIREDTRRIRRLLQKAQTVLRYVTISHDDGRWRMSVTIQTGPLHPEQHAPASLHPVGIDRGLTTFAVVATAAGEELERIHHPRPLRAALPRLRRLSRSHSRKTQGSANRRRSQRRLQRMHARIRNLRQDFVRRVTSRLAKTHGHLVLETLNTQGLMKTRMARSLADSGWAQFATRLTTKSSWHGGTLTLASRTFPSTRRCSACAHVGDAIPLSQRWFHCGACGFQADRDTNAAINLGQFPSLLAHAAGKPPDAQTACREGSAGLGKASGERPREPGTAASGSSRESGRLRPTQVKLPSMKQE